MAAAEDPPVTDPATDAADEINTLILLAASMAANLGPDAMTVLRDSGTQPGRQLMAQQARVELALRRLVPPANA